MTVSVEPLTDVDADAAFEIARAGWTFDHPDVPGRGHHEFRTHLRDGSAGHAYERYLARLDDVPAGYLAIDLPQLDNLDVADVELTVRPSDRRRGVGRALADVVVSRVRALGRHHLTGRTAGSHPDGAAFAAALGATAALEEARSRLDLPPADQSRLDTMLADAWSHADGYHLIQWTGVPPDEVIDDVARIESSFYAEAPIGDLPVEPEKVDAERMRRMETDRAARGRTTLHTGALSGERLVGWTTIVGDRPTPWHAWQSLTLVDPGHRGHRLGMLIKLANLAYAREHLSGLTAIDTFNGQVNENMLRINRAMGFRAAGTLTHWRLDL